LVRVGYGTWLFKLTESGPPGDTTDLKVTVAHYDDAPPGFYTLNGDIRQIQLNP
jgi:hypothetical protein